LTDLLISQPENKQHFATEIEIRNEREFEKGRLASARFYTVMSFDYDYVGEGRQWLLSCILHEHITSETQLLFVELNPNRTDPKTNI